MPAASREFPAADSPARLPSAGARRRALLWAAGVLGGLALLVSVSVWASLSLVGWLRPNWQPADLPGTYTYDDASFLGADVLELRPDGTFREVFVLAARSWEVAAYDGGPPVRYVRRVPDDAPSTYEREGQWTTLRRNGQLFVVLDRAIITPRPFCNATLTEQEVCDGQWELPVVGTAGRLGLEAGPDGPHLYRISSPASPR